MTEQAHTQFKRLVSLLQYISSFDCQQRSRFSCKFVITSLTSRRVLGQKYCKRDREGLGLPSSSTISNLKYADVRMSYSKQRKC
jgi:hypothetical protein